MRRMKICPGVPLSHKPGEKRMGCGGFVLVLFLIGAASLGTPTTEGLLIVGAGIVLASAVFLWGLNARFKWFARPTIVLDQTGLWHRDAQPQFLPWSEIEDIRESLGNDATPDFPSIEVVKPGGSIKFLLVGHLDRTPDQIVLAARNYHRRSLGRPTVSAEAACFPISCPVCSQPSNSVKCYRMGVMLYLIVAGSARWQDEQGCPSCIRGKIGMFMLVNLLSAHVAWPFVILPWGLVLLVRSFTKGHSRKVVDVVEQMLVKR